MSNQLSSENKIDDLKEQLNLLNEKLKKLNKQNILETRVEEQLRLKGLIDDTKTQRDEVEKQLKDMESQLANDGQGRSPQPCFCINLPNTGKNFIGREQYLHDLNQVWNDGKINILVIKATFGGEGKSALVNEWLKEILPDPGKMRSRKLLWVYIP